MDDIRFGISFTIKEAGGVKGLSWVGNRWFLNKITRITPITGLKTKSLINPVNPFIRVILF